MADLPNLMQTRIAKRNDTEEVVEEVGERPPAEVVMLLSVSFENPLGWYLVLMCLVVGFEVRFREKGCVRRCPAHG